MLEKLDLGGKVAIVTGGGTGLGKEMALALASAGADIVVTARRRELIEETASEVRKLGRRGLAISADITKSEQVNQMVATALAEFGQVDILINNAGVVRGQEPRPIWEITDDDWRLGIDTNLSGAFYCCRAITNHMLERKRGKIINVASGFGMRGARWWLIYSTAKAGVIEFTKGLAASLARDGINVNSIVPGFFASMPPDAQGREFLESRAQFIPEKRVGDPKEIGPLAVYLASEASDYVTGEIFIADGGGLAGGYAPVDYVPDISL